MPSFWDPQRRIEKPDTGFLHLIRFLTEDDFPPFNFALPDGALSGFNVDLARAICEELGVACTIQSRRYDLLISALDENKGDAIIASLGINPQTRARVDFTNPYFRIPARFVKPRNSPFNAAIPEGVAGRTIGVQQGTAHEAYLRAFFPKATIKTFADAAALRAALSKAEIDAGFGDAVGFGLWMNGKDSNNCCAFVGGAFLDEAYFGEGVAIALKRGNIPLRRALDWALARVTERGIYADLYLKYFPIGVF